MFQRILGLGVLTLVVGFSAQVSAQEHVDVSTDAEEMTADSEAAQIVAKATKARAARERIENARTLREANKARAVAEAKGQEASQELKRTEEEIRGLQKEQARVRKEIQSFEFNTMVSEKSIQDGRAKLEKVKGETTALQALRSEKEAKLVEINKSRDEVLALTKAAEQQRMQAQLALNRAKGEEVVEAQRLEKTKVDEAQNKLRLEAEIVDLRERYKSSHARIAEMEAMVAKLRQNTSKLESTVAAGENEVHSAQLKEEDLKAGLTPQQVQEINLKKAPPAQAQVVAPTQRAVNALPSAPDSASSMVLKRDCKIHGGPDRNSPVLGVKLGGQAITQAHDEQGWIAYPIGSGQKGFVAKTCF